MHNLPKCEATALHITQKSQFLCCTSNIAAVGPNINVLSYDDFTPIVAKLLKKPNIQNIPRETYIARGGKMCSRQTYAIYCRVASLLETHNYLLIYLVQ